MKELWDFNRSSAKSYLFFLIYFHAIVLGVNAEDQRPLK